MLTLRLKSKFRNEIEHTVIDKIQKNNKNFKKRISTSSYKSICESLNFLYNSSSSESVSKSEIQYVTTSTDVDDCPSFLRFSG